MPDALVEVAVTRPAERPASFVITGAGLTHQGKQRAANEDAILTDPSGRLWAVADGMGGHAHGALAADIVIDCLAGIEDLEGDADPAESLIAHIAQANRLVRHAAGQAGAMMGATVVAIYIGDEVAHLVWAGDSRAYLWRRGDLRRLSHDHTVVQGMVDRAEIDAAMAESHPRANIVTRAVGADDDIDPDHAYVPLMAGDRMLLCSDGLQRCVPEGAIAAILGAGLAPDPTCRALVAAVLDAGAPDNVSVIVIDCNAGDG